MQQPDSGGLNLHLTILDLHQGCCPLELNFIRQMILARSLRAFGKRVPLEPGDIGG